MSRGAPTQSHSWAALIGLLLIAVLQSAEASSRSTASYTVRLEEEDRRLLKVEAVIETAESELLMFADNYDASHLQGGWASFVRNLRLRDENGAAVAVEPSGLSRWRLPSGEPRKLRMSYEVHEKAAVSETGPWHLYRFSESEVRSPPP